MHHHFSHSLIFFFLFRAWVYTFVSADHGGDLLLPHFINYYHQLGITYRRFLVLVHHTPGKWSRVGLERLAGICQGYSLECRLWEGEYTPDAHLEQQLIILKEFVDEPLDWIIVTDVDELQHWPTDNINQYLTDENTKSQATFFMGDYVERIAPQGELTAVVPVSTRKVTPSLFQQYPQQCVSRQRQPVVTAFKAYLRTARDRRSIVIPDAAKSYFSPCVPGLLCPRSSLRLEDMNRDLFHLTPYSLYENRYRYIGTPPDAQGEKYFWPYRVFNPAPFEQPIIIQHFKWHSEVVDETGEQLERYRGDCSLQQDDAPDCHPLVPRWKELAAAWRRLRDTRRVNTAEMYCDEVQQEEGDGGNGDEGNGNGLFSSRQETAGEINTAYMGLAWEEFEAGLHVESKVRNKVKGDSQTRLAGMLETGEQDVDIETEWDDVVDDGGFKSNWLNLISNI